MAIQFLPMPAIAYPQNAMVNFQPLTQAIQWRGQHQLDRDRFGLQQNADLRAQEMHPLSMDYQRAQTAGLVGQEGRAQERQPYDLRHLTAQTNQANAGAGLSSTQAQLARLRDARDAENHQYEAYRRWYEAAQPGIAANALAPLMTPGMQPPTLPMPPLPASARGQAPAGYAAPMGQPPAPAAARPSPAPVMSNPPGISVAPPQAPQGMPAPPAQPAAAPAAPSQQPGTLPNGMTREQYARALLEAGIISQDRYRQLTRDGYLGLPDGAVTAGVTNANTAGQAAMTAQGQVTNLQGLLPLVDQAYVGALSGSREAAANLLQSLGYDPSGLLQNQSLTATTLLRQGLSQLPLPVLADLRPASNTDLQFAQSVSPNMTNSPAALQAGLRALIRVRQREALFQTLLSQELQRTPFPNRQAILARVLEAIPAAPVLPDGNLDLGQGGQRGRRPTPVNSAGNALPGLISDQHAQAINQGLQRQADAATAIDNGATLQPSTSGGTPSWRSMDAQGQVAAIQMLFSDFSPMRRRQFAQQFGNDVLAEALRQRQRRLQ